MAAVVAPGSLDQHHNAPSAMNTPHGKKRPADSSLDGEQRLSKRFDLLNLGMLHSVTLYRESSTKLITILTVTALDNTGNGARLYIPLSSSTDTVAVTPTVTTTTTTTTTPHPLASDAQKARRQHVPRPSPSDDSMLVEDTPHRVYIHDLAAELNDLESDEENPIFLSDIEKHLSKIPQHVLLGPSPKSTEHNQMVLYNVPASLTVPEEQDNVRKAIVEARQRIREKQVSGLTEPERVMGDVGTGSAESVQVDDDADVMDLD